jgi:hexosaminidase
MRRAFAVLTLLVTSLAPSAADAFAGAPPGGRRNEFALIPWPRRLDYDGGVFELTDRGRITYAAPSLKAVAEVLASDVRRMTGQTLATVEGIGRSGDIELRLKPANRPDRDEFHIYVGATVAITADSVLGASYATATLLQLLSFEADRVTLPQVSISDAPALAYSGTMLDVARKPYSIETLKECVDVCRFYKIRYIQLHMTDENAWTFPSKSLPKLGSQNFAWAGGDAPKVYPVDELKALVAYAEARGVVFVPEIEMPGHSGQLRGTYPEVFGYRKADGTAASIGVINMTSPKALAAIDGLIGEACEIFSTSPYIHIGCDEASLGGLEEIPEVTEALKTLGQTGTHAVFNEFVHRVHAMVKARGRTMIVWEGAPTGPKRLPDDIVFMPWVGGSTAAAELVGDGHRVINAPWGVEKPYFDPHRVNGATLARGEPKLIGATSILWESTEDKAVPYLRFTGALRGEPTWTSDSTRTLKDFMVRIDRTDRSLDRLLYGFTVDASGLQSRIERKSLDSAFLRTLELKPISARPATIRYTLDGSDPTSESKVWDGSVAVAATTLFKARRFTNGKPDGGMLVRALRKLTTVDHDAIGAKVTVEPDRPGYAGPGPQGLTDGRLADGNEFDQQGWVGWANNGQPVTITLDLGKLVEVRHFAVHALRGNGGVFPPAKVEWAVSEDRKEFRTVGVVANEAGVSHRGWFELAIKNAPARYVRLQSTASADWTFLDEVMVNGTVDPPTQPHLARGLTLKLDSPLSVYNAAGVAGLTDGYVSQEPNFLSMEWVGFEFRGLDATVDLGKPQPIKSAGARFLQEVRGGIWLPTQIEVLVSDDGTNFRSAGTFTRKGDQRPRVIEWLRVDLKDVTARHIRIKAATAGQWQFVDEVIVE